MALAANLVAVAMSGSVVAQTSSPSTPPYPGSTPEAAAPRSGAVSQVVVTASRANLLGVAITASQGKVTQEEIDLRPAYRIGQIYESVPGLVVTVHSGEGKANQYLLRGFNLDHGTDFASFVDDMPVNRPTNTHGQGYSDQNFLMPQLVSGLDYTKGPYYASIGDFGAVGSAHVRLLDTLPNQIAASVGTLGDEDVFASATHRFDADDRLWAAADIGHLDGPWSPPSDFNKIDLAARFSHGTDADGFSVTGMYYTSAGRLETDQSVYALQQGLIGRYGTLDPSDASQSERYSLSGAYHVQGDDWRFTNDIYVIHSTMTLWNDFTHYLFDPLNGDQEQQDETRNTAGIDTAFKIMSDIYGVKSETIVGVQDRYDDVYVDRRHTRNRQALDYCELANIDGTAATSYAAVDDACSADRVNLNDLGLYVDVATHWLPWLRTSVGLREEAYQANDKSLTSDLHGSGSQKLSQPKGSLVLGPWWKSEVYLSAGRGFHSNDVRGVFETVPLEGIQDLAIRTPLMSPATGEEIGLRTNIVPKMQGQVALFQEDFSSETEYDQDQGEDQASAPSRRQGVELSGQYHPFSWIEFNTDLAFSKARFRGSEATLEAFGIDGGTFMANAPSFIGSFGILMDNLGPWYGGLQWRDLGPYPVTDGSDHPQDKGYSEFNGDVGYKAGARLKFELSIYNLLNAKTNAAAYDYTSRLTPDGPEVTGLQVHPLEPISARFAATLSF